MRVLEIFLATLVRALKFRLTFKNRLCSVANSTLIPYRFEIGQCLRYLPLLSHVVVKTTGALVTDECVYSGLATAQVACPLLHRKLESKLRSTLLTRHTMDISEKKFFL